MLAITIAFVTLGYLVSGFIDCVIIDGFKYWPDIDKFVTRYLGSLEFKRHIDIILDQQIEPEESEIILKAFKSYHPVIITDPEAPNPRIEHCYKMHNIIGIYRRAESINPTQWRSFYGKNCWNSAAPIAIWIAQFNDLQDLQRLLVKFWNNNSINVVLLVLDESKNRTVAYTYDPFARKPQHGSTGGNTDQEWGELYEITAEERTLFPDKFKNLNGYSIPISLYRHQPHARLNNDSTELADGKDVNYCRFLAQWMNFSIALKTAKLPLINYIVDLPNKTRVNVIGDIITNRSMIIGNAVHLEIINSNVVDIIYPHWRSKIIIVVPSNGPTSGIVKILRSNSGLTLVLVFMAIIALTVFLMIRKEDNILLIILKLLLFQATDKIGEKSSARIFWISLIYWAFLLTTIFQSQFINDLSAPEFYDEIDNLDELNKSNFTLMIKQWEFEALNSSKLESKRRLLDQTVVEVDFKKCMSLLKSLKNVACTIDDNYAKFIKTQNDMKDSSKPRSNASNTVSVNFLDEPLISFWKTYAVKKDSPFLNKMNKITTRLVEKGIMKKWYNDDVKKNLKIQPSKPVNTNVGMDSLGRVFWIYACGNLVAGCCFLIEVIYYNFRMQKRF